MLCDSQDVVTTTLPDLSVVPSQRDATELLSAIDAHFIENLGQHGHETGSFYSMGDPLSVALGPGWVAYSHLAQGMDEGVMVRVAFEGSNTVEPVGVRSLSYPTNYLKGNDPDRWIAGVRSFEEVVYEELYDGIDLRWRFQEGQLKYDLIVGPYADFSQVQMTYTGHEHLLMDEATGDLVIRTSVVDLVDMAPVSFQDLSGFVKILPSRYVIQEDGGVSFAVDGRDPAQPLVIDPGLTFSTYVGGYDMDGVNMMTEDSAGDVYLAGYSKSTNFPTTPGVISPSDLGGQDAVVCKLKGDGTDLLWSTYVGSDDHDGFIDFLLDGDGNIVLTGYTEGADFPVTPGAYQTKPGGWEDAFVMELNHNASNIEWSTFLAGFSMEAGFDVELMSNGDIVVVGTTNSTDFPVVDGCFDNTSNGDMDTFAARLNGNGTQLLRSTYIGGSHFDEPFSEPLAVDDSDEIYIVTTTDSDDFPVSPNAFQDQRKGLDLVAQLPRFPGGVRLLPRLVALVRGLHYEACPRRFVHRVQYVLRRRADGRCQ
jgi:hypothetical protein